MIKVFPDIKALNNFAAEKFVEIGRQTIDKRGQFTVALSGGSTPKALFQTLSDEKFKDKIDWSRTFFFFGDERNVLPDDAESNFRMANENLFEPLKINSQNIFRWQTELENPQKVAENYEQTIENFFKLGENEFANFDLVFLGMGADGHTASLFPFTDALKESDKNAVGNYVEKLKTMRFTLTFPVINNAQNVFFLIKGADKSEALKQVLEGKFEPEKFPSQNVKPLSENIFWLCDAEAAAELNSIVN
jgi:6-phosphogluconolactonase